MAEVLDTFDWPQGRQGRGTKYPYEEWLDGKIRRLTRKQDFPTATVETMKNNLTGAAKKKEPIGRWRVNFAKVDEDTLVVQAVEKG